MQRTCCLNAAVVRVYSTGFSAEFTGSTKTASQAYKSGDIFAPKYSIVQANPKIHQKQLYALPIRNCIKRAQKRCICYAQYIHTTISPTKTDDRLPRVCFSVRHSPASAAIFTDITGSQHKQSVVTMTAKLRPRVTCLRYNINIDTRTNVSG